MMPGCHFAALAERARRFHASRVAKTSFAPLWWTAVGCLDTSVRLAFDYDLWTRLSRQYAFTTAPECLAASRMHRGTITLGQHLEAVAAGTYYNSRHLWRYWSEWISRISLRTFRREGSPSGTSDGLEPSLVCIDH